MKRLLAVALVEVGFFICTSIGFAQSQPAKYTAQEIYDFFAQYSPQDVMEYARLAAQHFAKQLSSFSALPKIQEEKTAGEALQEFYQVPSKFSFDYEPLHPFAVLLRCDDFRIVAHPIPEFFAVMSQKGFIKLYKDVKGKKIGLDLCERVLRKPEGVWGFQIQWWPQTDIPLSIGVFTIGIPNSNYQIQTYFPTVKFSESALIALENQ